VAEKFTEQDLEAYLEEGLDPEKAGEVEAALRDDPSLVEELARILARRESGVHTLGEIWRRHQVGVPTRQQLGSYLLDILPEEDADYIRFRVEILKCPFTLAKLADLRRRQEEAEAQIDARRRRYFQSSAGLLRSHEGADSESE
jgi:hypothetical protein